MKCFIFSSFLEGMGSLAAMQRSGGKGRYEVYVAISFMWMYVCMFVCMYTPLKLLINNYLHEMKPK